MIHNPTLIEELSMLTNDMRTSNQDLVISIFGREGSGKSTFALNLAKVLDTTFTPATLPKRTAQTFEDFSRKAPSVDALQLVWWDEAHRFGKRGTYDTETNRALLEYFQDSRGSRRIYLLCYPELKEIDRKVVQRSRLYFETIRKGQDWFVRGWRRNQVEAIIDSYRLYSYKSKMERWQGIPRNPITVFKHDYKGVEDLKKEYDVLKEGSLRRTDEKLRAYGSYNSMDVANEVARLDKNSYSFGHIQHKVTEAAERAVEEGWSGNDGLVKTPSGRWIIKSDVFFEKLVKDVLSLLPDRNTPKIVVNNPVPRMLPDLVTNKPTKTAGEQIKTVGEIIA